ncbi:MAG: DUF86 domain-containing protein [Candidatus Sericytochromatia bacterium]|nr:DUF86 domain-containing protein [Candidatus Tanganyikabacteria bacterium]
MTGDVARLSDILAAIKSIEEFRKDGEAYFFEDLKTQHAVFHDLVVIGEAVRNLTEATKLACPETPWDDIKGLRNKLTHEYSGINLEVVWRTVIDDLPPLREAAEGLLGRFGG